ncbi:L,D-transpeptidase family protein [Marinimicrobium sp. ABcell2]|uniref:L,D-transpeptidase family protein n=1 Tax=Marinimicrobium sp. ABcell2 TaxID=3069751 RepID=UPI0027AE7AC4|nr:L,D-transpeptidase family protein [Marinimicrobium sp. ABcell2]MDQ2076548.1 L,D-transpeptidase family protein [Marinimicrobium sp. ABcell2]
MFQWQSCPSVTVNRVWVRVGLVMLFLCCAGLVEAHTYTLSSAQADVVGEVNIVKSRDSDTLMDIAREHSMGYREMRLANPDTDIWLPGEDNPIVIPSQFILPDAPRDGIVLNRSEKRLYYFHSDPSTGEPLVTTYPMGIGREDRQTPTGRSRIVMKMQNPAWYPTANIRADFASRGVDLPLKVPPGPDNPLGEYAIMLDIPGYLIHGTNRPDGIGMRVSQGCIRLYPEHIEALVKKAPLQTPVTIIDQPYKVGILDGELMVEVHPVVYPDGETNTDQEQRLVRRIIKLLDARGDELKGGIDWNRVTEVFRRADGIPAVVSYLD